MTPQPTFSIVIPCHNEADHIAAMLERVRRAFAETSHEVVLVIDGCTDATETIAQATAQTMPALRILTHPTRLGKGGAIRRGMNDVHGAFVGFIDGDNEIDPLLLRQALEQLKTSPGLDIVVGNRYGEGGAYHTTPLRHLTSRVYQAVLWILFGLKLHDTQAGVKAFTAMAARTLFSSAHINGYAFDIDVLTDAHWRGYTIEEHPIQQRFKGTSTMRFSLVLEMIVDTCRIYDRHVRALCAQQRPPILSIARAVLLLPFTWIIAATLGTILHVIE